MQVVFDTAGNLDVISNLKVVDSFIGSGASLASLVTLVLIVSVLSDVKRKVNCFIFYYWDLRELL